VTANELKRWLRKQGCTFTEGKKHTIVYYGSEFTEIPRHPTTEIKTGTYHAILKKLGLKT
jgi:mRNA interferase HicA